MMKGSIVLKRTVLLQMIENYKMMFRASQISKDAKHVLWGEQMACEIILEETYAPLEWDERKQRIMFEINPRLLLESLENLLGKIQ